MKGLQQIVALDSGEVVNVQTVHRRFVRDWWNTETIVAVTFAPAAIGASERAAHEVHEFIDGDGVAEVGPNRDTHGGGVEDEECVVNLFALGRFIRNTVTRPNARVVKPSGSVYHIAEARGIQMHANLELSRLAQLHFGGGGKRQFRGLTEMVLL